MKYCRVRRWRLRSLLTNISVRMLEKEDRSMERNRQNINRIFEFTRHFAVCAGGVCATEAGMKESWFMVWHFEKGRKYCMQATCSPMYSISLSHVAVCNSPVRAANGYTIIKLNA